MNKFFVTYQITGPDQDEVALYESEHLGQKLAAQPSNYFARYLINLKTVNITKLIDVFCHQFAKRDVFSIYGESS